MLTGRSAGASPFVVRITWESERSAAGFSGTKPVGDFAAHALAVRVVDMLAGRENFDRLGSGSYEAVEQAWVQALFHVKQGRDCFQHVGFLRSIENLTQPKPAPLKAERFSVVASVGGAQPFAGFWIDHDAFGVAPKMFPCDLMSFCLEQSRGVG